MRVKRMHKRMSIALLAFTVSVLVIFNEASRPVWLRSVADSVVGMISYRPLTNRADIDINDKDVLVVINIPRTGILPLTDHIVRHAELEKPCQCRWYRTKCQCLNTRDYQWLFNAYNSTGYVCGENAGYSEIKNTCPIDYWLSTTGHDHREFRRYHLVTMLRDPISRYISEWVELQRHDWYFENEPRLWRKQPIQVQKRGTKCFVGKRLQEVTLEDFVSCPDNPANNRMTKMLANRVYVDKLKIASPTKRNQVLLASARNILRKTAFFGMFERVNDSQVLMEEVLGVNFNKTLSFGAMSDDYPDISPILKHKILMANDLDFKLYAFAKDLFEVRMKEWQSTYPHLVKPAPPEETDRMKLVKAIAQSEGASEQTEEDDEGASEEAGKAAIMNWATGLGIGPATATPGGGSTGSAPPVTSSEADAVSLETSNETAASPTGSASAGTGGVTPGAAPTGSLPGATAPGEIPTPGKVVPMGDDVNEFFQKLNAAKESGAGKMTLGEKFRQLQMLNLQQNHTDVVPPQGGLQLAQNATLVPSLEMAADTDILGNMTSEELLALLGSQNVSLSELGDISFDFGAELSNVTSQSLTNETSLEDSEEATLVPNVTELGFTQEELDGNMSSFEAKLAAFAAEQAGNNPEAGLPGQAQFGSKPSVDVNGLDMNAMLGQLGQLPSPVGVNKGLGLEELGTTQTQPGSQVEFPSSVIEKGFNFGNTGVDGFSNSLGGSSNDAQGKEPLGSLNGFGGSSLGQGLTSKPLEDQKPFGSLNGLDQGLGTAAGSMDKILDNGDFSFGGKQAGEDKEVAPDGLGLNDGKSFEEFLANKGLTFDSEMKNNAGNLGINEGIGNQQNGESFMAYKGKDTDFDMKGLDNADMKGFDNAALNSELLGLNKDLFSDVGGMAQHTAGNELPQTSTENNLGASTDLNGGFNEGEIQNPSSQGAGFNDPTPNLSASKQFQLYSAAVTGADPNSPTPILNQPDSQQRSLPGLRSGLNSLKLNRLVAEAQTKTNMDRASRFARIAGRLHHRYR